MHLLERDVADAVDARAVLATVLALHDAEDLETLVGALPRLLGELIPHDSLELVGELAAAPSAGPRSAAHRLAIRTAGADRTLVGVVLARRHAFLGRDTAVAGLLGPHLGAAVDHVRLRAARRATAQGAAIACLTTRERQVLALVADGRRDRDIAEVLHIEPRTVEKHVEHIRSKLGARSRAEAVARWARALA